MGKTKEIIGKRGKIGKEIIIFFFKDNVTGTGKNVDPGANEVIGKIFGKGISSLVLSDLFLRELEKNGIPTHLIDVSFITKTMTVKKAELFGENGLEFICRRFAYGSFLRRYSCVKKMEDLNYLVEVTLKDDERDDPLINDDALVVLDLITAEELQETKRLTKTATKLISEYLRKRGLVLIDIKLEFGICEGKIVVIDEISGDSMRAADKDGKILPQLELHQAIMSEPNQ